MVRAYTRLRIGGSMPSGEVWSINPAFIGNFDETPPGHDGLQAWADDAMAFIKIGMPTSLRYALSSAASIDTVRAEYYDTTGRLADYAVSQDAAPLPGLDPLKLPVTTAIVCSLYTGIPGRSYRGRIYWPLLGFTLSPTTGRLDGGDQADLLAAFGGLLAGLEAAAPASPSLVLGVYSTTRGSGTAVSQLRVGDIPDSQRGRKSALVEAYSIAAFPPA